MFWYKCTIFRENKMLVLNTNHHLKAVIYLQHVGDTVRNEALVMQSTQTHHINSVCLFFIFYYISVIHIHHQVVTEHRT
jgi:hypothetical protein